MNAPTRVTPTSELYVPLLHYRNRSIRHGLLWEGTLGGYFGAGHTIRDKLRGAPAFTFGISEPGEQTRTYHALVLAYDLEADPAFLSSGFLRGRAFVLFTAFGHRAGGVDTWQYRVVLPLSRPVGPADYKVLARAVDAELGGLADPRLERRDRRWPIPVCPPERQHLATLRYGDGARVDVDSLLGTRISTGPRRLA